MRRLSGRFRSSLIIGVQGIRSRKLRTLLSMVSLFLGVLAVVVVQAGASIAERALLADLELTNGIDGTKLAEIPPQDGTAAIAIDTVRGRADAVTMLTTYAIVGEPGVRPINEGASPFDELWGGGGPVCYEDGRCDPVAPAGQAVEMRLTALTGDIRPFRPLRPQSGEWLSFDTVPALAPRLVLNLEAAKGFERHRVPAEMRFHGPSAHLTPQFVGVVDDGDMQPHAYVRLDEVTNWLPAATLSDPNAGMQIQVLLSGSTPVEQVLTSRLKGVNAEMFVTSVDSRKQMRGELKLMRLVFLSMAGLVLLIGVAGILNVGLATVGERVEEFALRRAVGTPRSLLAGIVLTENLLTGLLTAGAAIGVSVAALEVAARMLGPSQPLLAEVQFPWDAGVAGVIAGLVAGILGGFVPALRAAKIPIATVMRA